MPVIARAALALVFAPALLWSGGQAEVGCAVEAVMKDGAAATPVPLVNEPRDVPVPSPVVCEAPSPGFDDSEDAPEVSPAGLTPLGPDRSARPAAGSRPRPPAAAGWAPRVIGLLRLRC
jgi:hypothetical protein